MINLSVIRAHSLENSDFPKKALIYGGYRSYYVNSEFGKLMTEVRRRTTEDGGQRVMKSELFDCGFLNFGIRIEKKR